MNKSLNFYKKIIMINIFMYYYLFLKVKRCAKNADLFKIQIVLLVLIVEKCYAYR